MLELSLVQAGYGSVEVLHAVDLVVPDGAAVALLGSNGAGKTTLLKAAAGLVRASAGTVRIAGSDVTRDPANRRTRQGLCLIPEGRGIFRQLSVRENIAMYAGGRNVSDALARAARAFPVLLERSHQTAGTLSGGQQQMLAVARALVSDAPLILADELSVGLAPVIVDEIYAAVGEMRNQGRSLLIVEQYVGRALALADYVYVLHKGRIVFVGEPEQCQHSQIFERYMGSAA
jgi:branched-chain amino acid transport system ATP-binding protein